MTNPNVEQQEQPASILSAIDPADFAEAVTYDTLSATKLACKFARVEESDPYFFSFIDLRESELNVIETGANLSLIRKWPVSDEELAIQGARQSKDYIRGVLSARNVLIRGFDRQEQALPHTDYHDEQQCSQNVMQTWSEARPDVATHTETLKGSLLEDGLSQDALKALIGENTSLAEQLGRLETFAFYNEAAKIQAARELNAPRFSVAASHGTLFGAGSLLLASEVMSKPDILTFDPLGTGPFNYFTHAANLSTSAVVAGVTSLALGIGKTAESRGWSLRKTRTIAGVGGMAVATLLNVVTETKLGVKLLPVRTTPDAIDLVYGIAGGALGVQLAKVDETNPHKPQ